MGDRIEEAWLAWKASASTGERTGAESCFRAGAEWMRAEAKRLASERARHFRELRDTDYLRAMGACAELANDIASIGAPHA